MHDLDIFHEYVLTWRVPVFVSSIELKNALFYVKYCTDICLYALSFKSYLWCDHGYLGTWRVFLITDDNGRVPDGFYLFLSLYIFIFITRISCLFLAYIIEKLCKLSSVRYGFCLFDDITCVWISLFRKKKFF